MKTIIYLMAGLALGGMSLTGCNEDRYPETDSSIIGDTANAPEGYMTVSFVPKGGVKTRANHSGEGKDLFHIQYFLYDNEGNIVKNDVVLDNPVQTSVTWPYENGGFTQTLLRGATYRIVYLGNVATPKQSGSPDEDLLTGEENYRTARIHRPANGFENDKLFYIFSKEFTVPDDETQTSLEIEIVLRRLVTKHSIASYGIPAGFDPGTGSYSDRFWESLLDENHPLGVGKQLFGDDLNSMLGKQFRAQVFRDIIFPVAYLFSENNCVDTNTKLGQDWNDGTINTGNWDDYPDGTETYLKDILKFGGYSWSSASSTESMKKQYKALYQLIADIYEDKDGILTQMYKRLKSDNLRYINTGGQAEGTGSLGLAKKNTAQILKNSLQGTGFGVWDYDELTVESDMKVPTEIALDGLTITSSEDFGKAQTVKLSSEKSLDFLLLGTSDETPVFSFTKIYDRAEGDVTYPDLAGFQPGNLTPNVAYTYRIQPTGGELHFDPDKLMPEDKPDNIYFSYYNMLKDISDQGKLGEDLKLETLIQTEGFLQYPLACVYGYGDLPTAFLLDGENGVYSGSGYKQFYMEFNHPDFGQMDITTEWRTESSLSE